jgi:cysteine desulfurase
LASGRISDRSELVKKYLFFDNASTTKCCEEAITLIQRFATEDFGNPSSSHALGQSAARAIREARIFFAEVFRVEPEQVIFTGSGSEADNLAVYGVGSAALIQHGSARRPQSDALPRVIASTTEHPAVTKTAQSLVALGVDTRFVPVDSQGQVIREKLIELLTPATVLVSIHQVNNVVGSVLPVDDLAVMVKKQVPTAIFHTDAVQAFGRMQVSSAPSFVDLLSISGHKIEGPKGVGALIVLNRKLLKCGLRPIIWGGEQEGGLRSGTPNVGLIAGFHAAAKKTLTQRASFYKHTVRLRDRLREQLLTRNLVKPMNGGIIHWNSPENAIPHIVSLSAPGFPSGPLTKLMEERGCLVSTGSACNSQKTEPNPVLAAMGLSHAINSSAIRISFSDSNSIEAVDTLVGALEESLRLMRTLLGTSCKSEKQR